MTSPISTMTSSRHYYELVILDVDQSFTDAEVTSWLVEEYGGALSARRVLLFPDRSPSTLVRIRVQDRATYNDILHAGCWINGHRYQVQLPDRRVPRRCYRCQRVGDHLARACTRPLRCVRCAGEHSQETCASSSEQCANCGQAHRADSRTCEYWLRQIRLHRGYRGHRVFKPSKREPGELKTCCISLDEVRKILESLKTTEDKYEEMRDLVKMFSKDMVDIRCSLTSCRRTRDQCQDICDILKLFSKDILDVKVSLASLNQTSTRSRLHRSDPSGQSLSPRHADFTWDDYDLSQPSHYLSNLDLDLDLALTPIPEELSDLDLDRIGRLSPFLLTDARTPSVLSLASPTDSEPIMTSSHYSELDGTSSHGDDPSMTSSHHYRSELYVTLYRKREPVGASSYFNERDVTPSHESGPMFTSSHYSELDMASSHADDPIMTSSHHSKLDVAASHDGVPIMTSSRYGELYMTSSLYCDPIMTSSRYEGDPAKSRDIVEDVLTTSHESVYDVHLPDTASTVTSFQVTPSESGISTWASHLRSLQDNPPSDSGVSTRASLSDSLTIVTTSQDNPPSESGVSTRASLSDSLTIVTSSQDNPPSESGISTWASYADSLPIVTSFKDVTPTPSSGYKFLSTLANNVSAGDDTDKMNSINENLENPDEQTNRRRNEEDPVYRDFCQKLVHRSEQEFKDFEKQFNPFHGEVLFSYSGGRISRAILVISMDGTVTDVRPCKIHITVINQLKTEHVTCCTFHHLASEIRDTIDKHDFMESVKMWRVKDLTPWCKKWQPSDYKRLERKCQGEKNGKRRRRKNQEAEATVI